MLSVFSDTILFLYLNYNKTSLDVRGEKLLDIDS